MILDGTVYLSHNPLLFGTQGRLILDISIALYSVTRFSILFFYFVLQAKLRLETSQGVPPPHQTAGNVGNGKSLEVGVSQIPKRWLQKKISCRSYRIQYRYFTSFLFWSFVSVENATHNFPQKSPTAPTACTRRRHFRAANLDAYLGSPSGH